MEKLIMIFLVLSLTVAATTSYGDTVIGPPPPPGASSGSHFGSGHAGVIIGSISVTAASLIACSIIVRTQRARSILGFPDPAWLPACSALILLMDFRRS